MDCCPNCFSDSFLNSRLSVLSNKKGKCSFCGSKDVTLISPEILADYFNPLIDIYREDSNGQPLNKLIQDDWSIFALQKASLQKKLLNAIVPEANILKSKFLPKHPQDEIMIKKWHSFTKELRHKNRFLPKGAPEMDLFMEFGPLLGMIIKKSTQKLFRARINKEEKNYKLKDLKKPPEKLAQNGRANPIGIPYLYVASTAETAIAEVRGHKGEFVTVLEFNVRYNLELFDLREPKNTISPFEWIDKLESIYAHMPYLTLLGNELSKPVVPLRANLEYLSTQYLCEMIKQIGYHGIVYKSSIASGNNLVIFKDNRLSAGNMCKYHITGVDFKAEAIR